MSLTPRAISKMLELNQAKNKLYVVQGSCLVKNRGNFASLTIFDGQQSNKAIVQCIKKNEIFRSIKKDEVFRLMIHEFKTYTWYKKKVIEIVDAKIINQSQNIKRETLRQQLQTIKLQQKKADPPDSQSINQPKQVISRSEKKASKSKPEPKKGESQTQFSQKGFLLFLDSDEEQPETKPENALVEQKDSEQFDIMGFQKVKDLFIGLHSWQLLVRVTDKSYREFISKHNNEVKLLRVEFIDRAGWTIEGCFFSEQAENQRDRIKVGKVYRVSRAKLEDRSKYLAKEQQKESSYSLKFYSDSSIVEAREVPEIPFSSTTVTRISQLILDEDSLNKEHNVVGILLDIGNQKIIPKQNRDVTIQTLTIGDPTSKNIINAVIWNKQVAFDDEMKGRTVFLKHFKLTKYKDSLNLSSTYRSCIEGHTKFQQYQGKWHPVLHQQQVTLKTLKDLEKQVKRLREGQSIVSTVNIWLNNVCFNLKWYYESCPNDRCRKAVEGAQQCQFCSFPILEPLKRFTLLVELSDFTGSIMATAFDEAADILVKHASIQDLSSMEQEKRHIYGTKLVYDNYYVKLISKLDNQGRVKHIIIGKPEQWELHQQSRVSLKMIQELRNDPLMMILRI